MEELLSLIKGVLKENLKPQFLYIVIQPVYAHIITPRQHIVIYLKNRFILERAKLTDCQPELHCMPNIKCDLILILHIHSTKV